MVIATNINCVDRDLVRNFKPDVTIMDEQGFAKEAETLLPVILTLETIDFVVLVGDHAQLQPVVKSHEEKRGGVLVNPYSKQQVVSLFERLFRTGYPTAMNRRQYRMLKGISKLSSTLFYNDRIIDDSSTAGVSRPEAMERWKLVEEHFGLPQDLDIPHMFIDVYNSVAEQRPGGSRCNVYNVHVVLVVIYFLIVGTGAAAKSICVIVHYKAQGSAYRRALQMVASSDPKWKDLMDVITEIEIRTVNSFQGNEGPNVILDFVVSRWRRGGIKFVSDAHWLNVSFSPSPPSYPEIMWY